MRSDPLSLRNSWKIRVNGLLRTVSPKQRNTHCYVVGTAKSGTHSLAKAFPKLRTMHEPSALELNHLIANKVHDDPTMVRRLSQWFLWRDRSMRLDVESNHFLWSFSGLLADLFPEARFIVLFRHPASWLNSWLNHSKTYPEPVGSVWEQALKIVYRWEDFEYEFESEAFRREGFHPLRSYLEHWKLVNQKLLDSIPEDRALWLETPKMNHAVRDVSRFLGVDPASLTLASVHEFKAAEEASDKLLTLETERLHQAIDEICSPTLTAINMRQASKW